MKPKISNDVQKFLLIFSSIFLILLFWIIFSLCISFIDYTMLWFFGLLILTCLGYAWFKLYKKSPALVIKFSLLIIFAILIGYFWYEAWRWESAVTDNEFGWYKFPVESRLEIIIVYLKALFETVAVFCVASFILHCFKIGSDNKKI